MDIKEITERLSTHSYTTPEDIWNMFLSIGNFFAIPNLILRKGTILYRAREVEDVSEIVNIKNLSYAPPEYNKTYNRASTPDSTMFYAISGDSFQECIYGCLSETCECFRMSNAEHRHYNVVVGLWETKVDLILPQIINVDGINKSDAFDNAEEFKECIRPLGKKGNDIINFWRYMNREFTKNVNHEKEYWVSAIFTKWLSQRTRRNGVIYESVQSTDPKVTNNHCVALTPNVADDYLRFKEALLYEFDYNGMTVNIPNAKKINI